MMATLGQLWQQASHMLAASGLDNARWEARYLIEALLDLAPGTMVLQPDQLVPDQQAKIIIQAVAQRGSGTPVGRIVGWREFRGLRFHLNDDTLEPRPDSETLIDAVLAQHLDPDAPHMILDLGCGTGCLGLTLLSVWPRARLVSIDIAQQACMMTLRNARHLALDDRIRIVCGDWLSAINGMFDVIISNPPYISHDAPELAPDVRQYDPSRALYGGEDGLDAYRFLMPGLKQFLKPGAICAMEIGMDQADAVAHIAHENGFDRRQLFYDLQGHPRIWMLKQPGFI